MVAQDMRLSGQAACAQYRPEGTGIRGGGRLVPTGRGHWQVSVGMSYSITAEHASATRTTHSLRALLALGVGGFSIGTGEFVIMGLLPEVARDVGVSIPDAGHLISAYALGVVDGAPVLAVLAARWPRRALLMELMALYALANFATALVPGYLAARRHAPCRRLATWHLLWCCGLGGRQPGRRALGPPRTDADHRRRAEPLGVQFCECNRCLARWPGHCGGLGLGVAGLGGCAAGDQRFGGVWWVAGITTGRHRAHGYRFAIAIILIAEYPYCTRASGLFFIFPFGAGVIQPRPEPDQEYGCRPSTYGIRGL